MIVYVHASVVVLRSVLRSKLRLETGVALARLVFAFGGAVGAGMSRCGIVPEPRDARCAPAAPLPPPEMAKEFDETPPCILGRRASMFMLCCGDVLFEVVNAFLRCALRRRKHC